MRLGLRLFFAFFLINGLAAFSYCACSWWDQAQRAKARRTRWWRPHALSALASADMEKRRF